MDRAPHVFLVPQPLDPHRRYRERLRAHDPVEGLVLPEPVVGRVLLDLPPERQLLEPVRRSEGAGRPGPQEVLVVVVALPRQRQSGAPRRRLAHEVVEVRLPVGAVVEPVVAHPAVHHRALRRGHLQGRVRVHERHHHGEALVRAAEHADPAVGLGHVLHEPVDRVVRIGRVIHFARVQRPPERTRHDVLAFGSVLAAHVLEHADVAVLHEDLVALRQQRHHVRRGRPLRAARRVVRRAGQEHRRVIGAAGNDDDGVELHAVAHGNHDLAPDVVIRGGGRLEGRRDVGRERRGLRRGGHCQRQQGQSDRRESG